MGVRPLDSLSSWILLFTLSLSLICAAPVRAQGAAPALSEEFARWTVNGSVMHQFQSDLDRGGNFSVNRFFINGRWSHPVNSNLSLGIGLRYAYEDYSFSTRRVFRQAPLGRNSYARSEPGRFLSNGFRLAVSGRGHRRFFRRVRGRNRRLPSFTVASWPPPGSSGLT